MRRQKRMALQFETLERKELLHTGGIPVLLQHTYKDVFLSLDHYAGGFLQDHSVSNFTANLAHVAAPVPFGTKQLLPVWTQDVNILNRFVRGSAHAMIGQMKNDFVAFVKHGVATGEFGFNGPF